MNLAPGNRIGAYEIVALIGAGGMGEVYRARDAKLQRDVAIKVLPELFVRDPERLARFEREARTLAALNHPHVAQVYGVVDVPGTGSHALILEFVDGEDLAGRISRAGALPIDEALPIAVQIAEALEAAHDQNIIHRDLKPANIKVRPDGQVKVLDFGLAKALAPVAPGSGAIPGALDQSPTITSPFQMSQLGVILGTAAYMAPEQAKGKAVDKRADIWAFGCVLFEMLTGSRPFAGEDITDTLAAIVRGEPDWSALPAATPPGVRTLLRRCLTKERRERLPDIGAARIELKDALLPQPIAALAARPSSRGPLLPWLLVAAASVAAIAAIVYARAVRPAPDTRVYKSVIMPPAPLTGPPAMRLSLSPDGRRLAFVAPDETGRTVLWIRPLEGLAAEALTGTANASSPFWSPDSRWVAFMADGKLKKIAASGGGAITLCDAPATPPGTWSPDGVILFGGGKNAVSRVDAAGGTPVDVTRMADGERAHISPFFLPDGRHFLYTVSRLGLTGSGVFVGSIDSPETTRVIELPTNAMYADGHLLYMRESTLMAQPFDPATRALSGSAASVAEAVQTNLTTGTGAFAVSNAGVLVYQTGSFAGTQLTLFSRDGKVAKVIGEPRSYRDVELSPDGRSASVTITTTRQSDIWIFDIARNLPRRFTFGNGAAESGVWSPDGRYLVYAAQRDGRSDIYRRPATGGGNEELLYKNDRDKFPLGFTPDGQTLLYRVRRSLSSGGLWLLPLTGQRTPRAFAAGDMSNVPAAVSPDGRWLAYVSEDSARDVREVFVTSFPENTGQWQVSTGGGDTPRWRADGKALYFTTADRLMAVDVTTTATEFQAGPVAQVLNARVPTASLATRSTYAVTAKGDLFLVNTWDPRNALTPMTLVVNWLAGTAK